MRQHKRLCNALCTIVTAAHREKKNVDAQVFCEGESDRNRTTFSADSEYTIVWEVMISNVPSRVKSGLLR